jgi:four helix bundle protein
MTAYKYAFEKLEVWTDARILVKRIYEITDKFPDKERFGLVSQMQRAAVSVVSNLAEGVSRNSAKEQNRFIEIAYGSLMEVYCQLFISVDLQYVNSDQFISLKIEIDKVATKLNALSKSCQKRFNT